MEYIFIDVSVNSKQMDWTGEGTAGGQIISSDDLQLANSYPLEELRKLKAGPAGRGNMLPCGAGSLDDWTIEPPHHTATHSSAAAVVQVL